MKEKLKKTLNNQDEKGGKNARKYEGKKNSMERGKERTGK